MPALDTTPRIANPDDLYDSLIDLHEGLSDEESAIVNARLIFVLINQIGDAQIVRDAISLARRVP